MDCQSLETLFYCIRPYTLSIVSCYLVSIFRLLESRDNGGIVFNPRTIHPWFRVWCSFLAFYSIFAFIGMTPYAIHNMKSRAWISPKELDWREKTDCCFWVSTFFFSKFIELGDTYFIVMLNRPLLLLQWFHHTTTLLYVEHALVQRRFSSFWFIYMNLFVHSIMYGYYVKKWILPWIITSLQVLQMIGGMSIIIIDRKDGIDVYGFTMYTLYFYLFTDYFIKRYIRKSFKSD
jgi:hypothetical protein